jgi:hypothetical protein
VANITDKERKRAISMIKRNGGEIKGKKIFHSRPGLRVLAAIDCLKHLKYSYFKFKSKGGKKKRKK